MIIFFYFISFLRFAESSGDDFIGNEDETPEEEDAKVDSETKRVNRSTNILVFRFPISQARKLLLHICNLSSACTRVLIS